MFSFSPLGDSNPQSGQARSDLRVLQETDSADCARPHLEFVRAGKPAPVDQHAGVRDGADHPQRQGPEPQAHPLLRNRTTPRRPCEYQSVFPVFESRKESITFYC